MITIHAVDRELRSLAYAIRADEGVDLATAFDMAKQQLPALLADVEQDTRYVPCRVVMFDRMLTAHELMEWTNRE